MNWKIRHKGLLIVCVPLLFEALFMSLLFVLLSRIDHEIQHEETSREVLALSHDFGRMCVNGTAAATAYGFEHLESDRKRALGCLGTANELLLKIERLVQGKSGEVEEVGKLKRDLAIGTELLMTPTSKGDVVADLSDLFQKPELQESAACAARLNSAMQQLMQDEERDSKNSLADVRETKRAIEGALLGGVLASAMLSVWLTLYFTRNIAEGIHNLARNAASLGRREPLAAMIVGRDEVAELDASLRRTDAELTQLERARQNLISFVSHELKTPLTALSSFFCMLGEGVFVPLNQDAKAEIDEATASLDEVNSLIMDLIDIEKMEGGKFKLLLSDVDVPSLIDSAVHRADVSRSAVNLDLNVLDDLLITADKERLCRVLTNLIKDAVNRSGGKGVVKVDTSLKGDLLEIAISDSGQALDQALKHCIFEKQQYLGDGDESWERYISDALPLITSRMIIEQHNGAFEIIEDNGINRFICRIPSALAELEGDL